MAQASVLESGLGELHLELGNLTFQGSHQAQQPVHFAPFRPGQWQRGEPLTSRSAEGVGVRALDQVAVEDRVNPIPKLAALDHQATMLRHPATKRPGGIVRDPDGRNVVRSQQVSQNAGIDLVGFHLGAGNGSGLFWIGNDDPASVLPQQVGDRPRVEARFQDDLVIRTQAGGKLSQVGRRDWQPLAADDPLARLDDRHLRKVFMHVESDRSHAHHLPDRTPAGHTTPTDSRSWRNRVSRRGGQLVPGLMVHKAPGLPVLVSPISPLSRWRQGNPDQPKGGQFFHTG